MNGGQRWSRLVFFLAAAGTAVPLWLVRYLPIQDLPQHVAAIRVLHDYDDPALGFSRFFELSLFRTQYLAYYLAAHALSYVLDVELANRLLVTLCVVGTPYAIAALLRALGRDPRFALLALPLAYNAHLILGFENFLLAIVLAFYGLALAVEQRRAHSSRRALGLAALALACFYAHVVPFAFLALGVGLVALQRDLRGCVRALLPLVPSSFAALVWTLHSPAGQATLSAARGSEHGARPQFQSHAQALADLPNWLTDVLHGDDDAELARVFYAVLALALALGVIAELVRFLHARRAATPSSSSGALPDALARSLAYRLMLLPPLAAALYFIAPTSYDWIWPIAQRFPLLALYFAIAVLPPPPRGLAEALIAATLCVSALQTRLIARAFHDFDTLEVADFDRALEAIPEGQRVAGLIFARSSRFVKFSPFIHYVAYYQARKGGAVMFTFADFPQSPFRFREHDRPPRVPPRWEWMPERVSPASLAWYDYVLVRGRAPQLERDRAHFEAVYSGELHRVYRARR